MRLLLDTLAIWFIASLMLVNGWAWFRAFQKRAQACELVDTEARREQRNSLSNFDLKSIHFGRSL